MHTVLWGIREGQVIKDFTKEFIRQGLIQWARHNWKEENNVYKSEKYWKSWMQWSFGKVNNNKQDRNA